MPKLCTGSIVLMSVFLMWRGSSCKNAMARSHSTSVDKFFLRECDDLIAFGFRTVRIVSCCLIVVCETLLELPPHMFAVPSIIAHHTSY